MGDIIMLQHKATRGKKNKMYNEIIKNVKNTYNTQNVTGFTNQFIDDIVDSILDQTDEYSGNGSTPIVKIINNFGFKTYKEDLPKEYPGNILTNERAKKEYGHDKVILVDEKDQLLQQRFVAAHELGHYLFDCLHNPDYQEKHYEKDNHKSEHERRANKFAAAILMPRKLFIAQYNHIASYSTDRVLMLMYLSKYFQTTVSAVEKRIKEVLGECVGYESEVI